jgi:hypothetical protein
MAALREHMNDKKEKFVGGGFLFFPSKRKNKGE